MKKYKIIFANDKNEIEDKINNFIEKNDEYDLKNIKVINNEFVIIFKKYS